MEVRAAVVDAAGARPVVQLLRLPDLGRDDVRVRVAATGVCHTDLTAARGGLIPVFPAVFGHETAGIVEQVGSGVSRVAPGDHVVISLAHHCGHCRQCEAGSPMLCLRPGARGGRFMRNGEDVHQGFGVGGFAEAIVVDAASAIPIPKDVPLDIAALLGCAVSTGLGAAFRIAQIRPASEVLVLGCGGIGLSVIMGAVVAGATRIVAVDVSDERRQQAMAFGATEALAPDDAQLEPPALEQAMAGPGFDYVFEAAGRSALMPTAVKLTRPGGSCCLIGVEHREAKVTFDAIDLVVFQRTILGCLTGDLRPNIDIPDYIRLYQRGLLPLERLISGRVPLEDLGTALDRCDRGEGLRWLVTFDGVAA